MFKNNKTANAVRTALFASLATSALVAPSAFAAEKDEAKKGEEVERIAVTGSRIQRTDMEGISPITVIGRDQLDVSGEVSVADVLRDSTFNSFGSSAESSGSGGGAQGIATVNLRGLGASRSLVLVNGKRVAPSPASGGGSANINAIPMAAVDRIEIVSAGASAVYGSDAIGGVVNIILRKDYEGVSVSASAGRPSQEGGDENSVSMVMGLANDKGSFIMSVEHSDREVIYSRDRFYTKSIIADTFNDNVNISSNGRNIRYDVLTNELDDDGDRIVERRWKGIESQCDTSNGFVGIQPRTGSQPGDMCGYDYTKIAAETTDIRNQSMYARGVYEINDDLTINLNTLATRFVSKGRFAPAAGNFSITGTDLVSDNVTIADGEKILNARAYWRFTDNGPRDSQTDGYNIDANLYLDGTTDWGNWTVGYHRNVATITELGDGYINKAFAEQFAAEGTLTDPRSVALMSHTISTYNKVDYQAYSAGVGFDSLFSMPAGDVGAYVYLERTETTYEQDSDALSDAVGVIGSSGGSVSGGREVTSLAAEMLLPITEDFEVNIAARFDDYSDFGSKVSPQIGATYTINDDWKLRSAFTKGFRAPTFSNLYQSAQSFDWVFVSGIGWAQYETNRAGNPELDAEESTQYSIGVVGNITDSISMTLDYQKIKITDLIRFESAASIWDKKINDIALLPGTSLTELNGIPDTFVASFVNQGEMQASYVDFNLTALNETSYGTFRNNLNISYTVAYELLENTPDANGVSRDVLVNESGIDGSPSYRATLSSSYEYNDHQFTVGLNFIPTQDNDIQLNDNGTGYVLRTGDDRRAGNNLKIDSYLDIDVNYTWQATEALVLNAGVRNLTDEDPRFGDTGNSQYNGSLYSLQGRTAYVSFKYDF